MVPSAREYVGTGAPFTPSTTQGLFVKEEVDLNSSSTAAFIFRQPASVEDVAVQSVDLHGQLSPLEMRRWLRSNAPSSLL